MPIQPEGNVRPDWNVLKNSSNVSQVNRGQIYESSVAYRGANADYLVYKDKPAAGVSWEDYQRDVLPVLAQRFPFLEPNAVRADDRKAIALNEAAWIGAALGSKGYQTVPVPKSLYDVFFLVFRLQDRFAQAREAAEQGREGSIPTLDPSRDPEAAWTELQSARLRCDVPALPSLTNNEGPVAPQVSAALRSRASDVRYQRAAHTLNQRTLAYMEKHGVDATRLNLPIMQQLAACLMHHDAPKAQYPDGSRPVLSDMFPKIAGEATNGVDFPNNERACTFIHAAIAHEYRAPPEVISLFRAAQWKDDVKPGARSANHSLSFGISASMGIGYDGVDGSPIAPRLQWRDFYATDVRKVDLLPGGALESVVRVPALLGPEQRIAETGEFYHPRLNPVPTEAAVPTGYAGGLREKVRRDPSLVIGTRVPRGQALAWRHALLTRHSTVLVQGVANPPVLTLCE